VFFDIGIGLLLASVIGGIVSIENQAPSPWLMLGVGVAGSLWPDIDFLIWIARGKKVDHLAHKHRDLLHKPGPLIAILSLAVYATIGAEPSLVFQLASIAHFVHDTIGHAWGIQWLWPFSDRYICYRSVGEQKARWYAWTPEQQDQMCEKYGDRHWAKRSYGSLSPTLVLESVVFLGGALAACEYIRHAT